MTAQIHDIFRIRDTEYSLAGISEGKLFDPADLELNPVMTVTACWRGYQAVFAVSDSRLVLDTLHVNLFEEGERCERKAGHAINGIKPTAPEGEYDFFNNHYEGLNYPLEYTGGLLLADGFIHDLYVHMGFHPAWKYEHVIELVFEKGVLTDEFDRSERMAELRRMIAESRVDRVQNRKPTDEEIRKFIEGAFDRTYGM